jgi:polyhydroxyalkanoate synthesis regulator phasin
MGERLQSKEKCTMRQEAWRAYAEMALGMTEASRQSATRAVKRLLGKGGATAEQLQDLAEELLKTSVANREVVTKMIRVELDRALGRMGLATADEVNELTERVRTLETRLRAQRGATPEAATTRAGKAVGDTAAAAVTPPARKVAKKAVRSTATSKAAGVASAGTAGAPATKGTAKKAVKKASGTAAAAKTPGTVTKAATKSPAATTSRTTAKRTGGSSGGTAKAVGTKSTPAATEGRS